MFGERSQVQAVHEDITILTLVVNLVFFFKGIGLVLLSANTKSDGFYQRFNYSSAFIDGNSVT